MQNLPILTAMNSVPHAASAQPATATDAAQPAEPFDKVLARQHAGADAQDASQASSADAQAAKAQAAQAQTTQSQAAQTQAGNDRAAAAATAATEDKPDSLPGDMLAALLPGAKNAAAEKAAIAEKISHKDTKKTAGTDTGQPDATALPSGTLPDPSSAAQNTASPDPNAAATAAPTDAAAAAAAAAATIAQATATAATVSAGKASAAQSAAQSALAGMASARAQRSADGLTASARQAQPTAATLPGKTQHTQNGDAANAASGDGSNADAATKAGAFSAAMEALSKNAGDGASGDAAKSSATQGGAPDAAAIAAAAPSGAAVSAVAHSSLPAQISINAPVGQSRWGDEFNQKITWLVNQREQTAELHLNPPQLGPLDVVINVSGDQATAMFTSSHAAVRDAVEQALPRLRDMLADNGITLGNTTVSDQSPRDQQAAWQSGQQSRDGNASGRDGDFSVAGSVTTAAVPAAARRHQGMVDTFA